MTKFITDWLARIQERNLNVDKRKENAAEVLGRAGNRLDDQVEQTKKSQREAVRRNFLERQYLRTGGQG